MSLPSLRILILCSVAAVVVTASLLAVSYDFCMGGPGRGLPFAAVHPSHDEGWWVLPLFDPSQEKWGPELDFLRVERDAETP
jgi:hypothetical protein